MRLRILMLILVSLVLWSCGSSKRMVTMESDIEELYQQGKYEKVLETFDRLEILERESDNVINENAAILAGKSAFHSGYYDQVHRYFDMTDTWQDDPDNVVMRGESYQNVGSSKNEYDHWRNFISHLEESEHYRNILLRKYRLEQGQSNFDAAVATWEDIPDRDYPDLMFEHVKVLERMGDGAEALSLANKILEIESGYEPALAWKAMFYFNNAETWYQTEMEKYDRNRNYTTYAYLRRELQLISAEFRTARDLFVELHQKNPDEVEYMRYLQRTYERLNMRDEAARMGRLIQDAQ